SATDFSDSASPIPSGNRWLSTAHPRPGPPHEPGGGPEKGLNAGFARSWLARYFMLHASRVKCGFRLLLAHSVIEQPAHALAAVNRHDGVGEEAGDADDLAAGR